MPNEPEVIDPDAILDTTVPAKTKEEEAAAAAAAGENADDEPFMEEVDLGNGESLTFTGKTAEELRDKVFAHIREQHKKPAVQTSAQEKTTETPALAAKPKELSEDDKFAITNEFKNGDPIKALNDLLLRQFDMDLGQVVEQAKQGGQAAISQARYNREVTGVAEFRKNHPEYVGHPANKAAMDLYLKAGNLEATAENLEKAFTELNASGVLKNDPPPNTENANLNDKGEGKDKGENNPNPPAKKAAASSMLWGRRGTTARRGEVQKKGPTDADNTKNFNEGGSEAVLAALQAAYEAPTA